MRKWRDELFNSLLCLLCSFPDSLQQAVPLLFFLSCVFCHFKGNRRREGVRDNRNTILVGKTKKSIEER